MRLSGHSAATGPDGRIYVVGGWDGSAPNRSIYIYQPSTNSWSTHPQPLEPTRVDFGMAIVGNTLYMIGGADGDSIGPIEPVYGLKLDQGGFITHANMPLHRRNLMVAVGQTSETLIFVFGGTDSLFAEQFGSVDAFSPSTGRWK